MAGPHLSLTQGGSNWAHPWSNEGSAGSTHRRLAAGEAERGGESGFLNSGDQRSRGGHLRVAGSKPQLLVVVVELGVVGNVAGDDLGGRRSRVKMKPRLRDTVRRVGWCVGLLGMQ